jgi:hypothetical protein
MTDNKIFAAVLVYWAVCAFFSLIVGAPLYLNAEPGSKRERVGERFLFGGVAALFVGAVVGVGGGAIYFLAT